MFYIIIVLIAVGALVVAKDWFFYKQRGKAIPDADQENNPIITGSADAEAHRQIDRAHVSKED